MMLRITSLVPPANLYSGKLRYNFSRRPFDRRQRVFAAQQRVGSHDVLRGGRDALVELGEPDLENRRLGVGNLVRAPASRRRAARTDRAISTSTASRARVVAHPRMLAERLAVDDGIFRVVNQMVQKAARAPWGISRSKSSAIAT